MNKINEALKAARKIVIKIGSNTLAKADGTQNTEFMASFAEQCASLIKQGKQIILVSSGAQVAGVSTTKEWARKKDVHYRQALCSIGQVELMHQWRKAFQKQNLHIGQLLLTKDDFKNEHRSLNIRNTLFTLVDEGVVPIINENDSVSFDEIKIGDNDNLSALTAILWSADLLILFSDIDGVYSDNPKTNPFGTGGIETKIQAAEKVTEYGIEMLLANGGKENSLTRLFNEDAVGTLFQTK